MLIVNRNKWVEMLLSLWPYARALGARDTSQQGNRVGLYF